MKVLNIIETAYRATLEEQDDTIIWLSHALKGAGAELDVLLQGNAVNYSLMDQDASGLKIGDSAQTQPPDIAGDIQGLLEKGCKVLVIEEDLNTMGIQSDGLLPGLTRISREQLADCFGAYDQVWHW